jgi:glycosyltransferase involved in cell wall biosynthesis
MADDLKTPLISVVLCTYNPRADYLRRCVDGVKAQSLPRERWEFVVVDNNSTKPLSSTIGPQDDRTTFIDLSWHPDARMVVETQQGLSHARRRGFQEARGELIVNLDDDAVLDADYLEQVDKLAQRFPFIGAFGSQLRPEFERAPEWPVGDYYGAQRTVAENMWSNDREQFATTPAGVGSVVRRAVADAYVARMQSDPRWALLGRTADKLLSCEDIEIAMTACDLGLGKGVFKDLKLTHLIPAKRMTEYFLCRNAHGNGYSSVVHNFLRFGRVPPQPSIFGRLNRLYRLWRMSHRKRREEMAKDRGIREGREMVMRLVDQASLPSDS